MVLDVISDVIFLAIGWGIGMALVGVIYERYHTTYNQNMGLIAIIIPTIWILESILLVK